MVDGLLGDTVRIKLERSITNSWLIKLNRKLKTRVDYHLEQVLDMIYKIV